ncbi:hypothetical protein LVY72_22590 [Arthrobacter sp. I2-34]|uniref:Uncharacterized protein n=1 Tax=Arthrobacter hankyongi TaxID=2904801 RepID=A0ABS9LE30_9MICC|nr:hypothetical protein [Arthrobacter hankyongi]MCG2624682.1 hypothetical protein [Arthrobacter hankyongi]
MGKNTTKATQLVGDWLIGAGTIIILLTVLMLFMTLANGTPSAIIFAGGPIFGLLMICAGYLKRIAAELAAARTDRLSSPVPVR